MIWIIHLKVFISLLPLVVTLEKNLQSLGTSRDTAELRQSLWVNSFGWMETCHIHSPTLETNVRRVVLSHDPLSFQWMSRSRVASPASPHWLFFAHLGCLKYFDVCVWHLSRKLYNKKDMVTLIVPCKKVHLNDSNLVRDIFIFILDAPAYCEGFEIYLLLSSRSAGPPFVSLAIFKLIIHRFIYFFSSWLSSNYPDSKLMTKWPIWDDCVCLKCIISHCVGWHVINFLEHLLSLPLKLSDKTSLLHILAACFPPQNNTSRASDWCKLHPGNVCVCVRTCTHASFLAAHYVLQLLYSIYLYKKNKKNKAIWFKNQIAILLICNRLFFLLIFKYFLCNFYCRQFHRFTKATTTQ